MSPSRENFPSDSFSKSLTSAVRWLSLGHISVLQYINDGLIDSVGRGLWRTCAGIQFYWNYMEEEFAQTTLTLIDKSVYIYF